MVELQALKSLWVFPVKKKKKKKKKEITGRHDKLLKMVKYYNLL
jgi:hypothetical protein